MLKIAVVILLAAVVAALAVGAVSLIRERGGQRRTVRALSWRLGLSLALIALILLGVATGALQPHDLGR